LTYAYEEKKYLFAFRYDGLKDEKMTPSFPSDRITAINCYIPDVYMARDVMIIFFFESHWKGWALKIEIFLGPEMTRSEASATWAIANRQ
jgi:hypothetical protein